MKSLFRNICVLLLMLVVYSCANNATKSANDAGLLNDSFSSMNDEKKIDSLINQYPFSTFDPDTSLAVFLWIDTIPEFDNSIEEYTRFAVEKDKIMRLLRQMFGTDFAYHKRVADIEYRANQFDKHVKEVVLNEAINDSSLSDSRELWYIRQTDKKLYDSLLSIYPIFH